MTAIASETVIAAAPRTIYDVAAATERWPEILPHYRFVRVLERRGDVRVVDMAAWRGAIPVRWTAEQKNDATEPHIAFRHIRGWTRGTLVDWRFLPVAGGTLVRIEHRIVFPFPVAREWLAQRVAGDYFIRHVAAQTLACMKRVLEAP